MSNNADRISSLATKLPNLAKANEFSNLKLKKMRAVTSSAVAGDILIGTFGSYARREASEQSDLDFFAICRSAKDIDATRAAIADIAAKLTKIAGRPPSQGGAFGDVEDLESILNNIGGNDDLNQKITRRVLLLLEGDWLSNEPLFQECRRRLLERYIRPSITSHQLALFLLNDIIRYYRTICVDFEFKTIENDKA